MHPTTSSLTFNSSGAPVRKLWPPMKRRQVRFCHRRRHPAKHRRMDLIFLAVIAAAFSCAGVYAQNPGKATVDTATNVGHAAVRHAQEAVETAPKALVPEPDAHRVDVTMTEYKFDMPTELKAGKTAFVVKNAGKKKH